MPQDAAGVLPLVPETYPDVTLPNTSIGLADEITGRLALDLAARLEEVETICRRYGITRPELEKILRVPLFQAMLRDANMLWNSSSMAPERIKQKALMASEHLVPRMFQLANDPKISAANRLAAGNYLATLAGLNKKDADNPGATSLDRFSLTINMGGGDKVVISTDKPSTPKTIEATGGSVDEREPYASASKR